MEVSTRSNVSDTLILKERMDVALAPRTLPGVESEADGKIRLLDYWRSVRKRLWMIAGIAALVTMLTTIYMARKPDIYQAQALVQIDQEDMNPALSGATKNSSVVVNSQVNDPAYFNTQLRILTSPGLLRRVVKTLDPEVNEFLDNQKAVNRRSTWQNLRRMFGMKDKEKAGTADENRLALTSEVAPATSNTDLEEAERYQTYVKDLQEDLQVEPVIEKRMGFGRDTTRLIEIRYKHSDPRFAAKVVNVIADVLAQSNLERKAEKNVSTGSFLQKRIAELQSQIRSGEERLIEYAKSKEILSLDASQNTVVERLIGLNKQLLESENERKLAETAYQAALAPGAASALAEENISKQLTDSKTRLGELWQKRAQLLVENTEEWPEVKEITQQIKTLEKDIEQARDRSTNVLLTNLGTRYRQTLAREQALRADFNKQRSETLAQNEAAVNYRIIQQEIETNKNLLNGLLQSYRENAVVLAGVYNNVRIIDYAVAPDKPTGPKRLQGVALALILSLPTGIGLALLMEHVNDTVRSVDDVEKKLHLAALAAIPIAKTSRFANGRAELLIGANPNQQIAEAYRQLRTAVLLSTPGRAPKTLLVSSCVPAEGKTTSSINLAISLAQTNARVLLIDADLRRPRLRTVFGLNGKQGLSTYLSRTMSEPELLEMIQPYGTSNLHVLTAGPVPPNPAELLGSEQMRRFIKTLEPHYDYIVIDSAPVASFTDGVLVSSMVDGVLMVVRCGKTPREALNRSRQMLLAGGANILGAILNQVEMRPTNYYQGYYAQVVGEPIAGAGNFVPDSNGDIVAEAILAQPVDAQVLSADEPDLNTNSHSETVSPQSKRQKRRRK
ncbi:MAG: polysaccharide biosynthesis tyrosine autokinase [Acidobacteria bacterium]|nr:polysaccharide biosynthesis tyrosine autokinase [Acidobacteriota bacterium]